MTLISKTTEFKQFFPQSQCCVFFMPYLNPSAPSDSEETTLCFEKKEQNPTASHHKRKIAWHSKKKRDLRQILLHISEADVASHLLQEDRTESPGVL